MALIKKKRPSLKYKITSDNNILPIIYAGVQQGVKSYNYVQLVQDDQILKNDSHV